MEEEIVLRVDMHCEGCAKKVAKALRGFEGIIIIIFIFFNLPLLVNFIALHA